MSIIISDKIQEKIYDDAAQPASQSFGKAVEPVGEIAGKILVSTAKTVDVLVFTPLHLIAWTSDTFKEKFAKKIEDKIKNIPQEKRIEPDPLIAGPTLQAVRFTAKHENLQDLFANLLATAIDIDTAKNAHPAFVEIAKQLTPDEAKILRFVIGKDVIPVVDVDLPSPYGKGSYSILQNVSTLVTDAGCQHDLGPTYISNLCRLEIFNKATLSKIVTPDAYSRIKEMPQLKNLIPQAKITESYIRITDFGRQFINACVVSKN